MTVDAPPRPIVVAQAARVIRGEVEDLRGALGEVSAVGAEDVREVERLSRAVAAVKLAVVALVDAAGRAGAVGEAGASGTASWLASTTKTGGADAAGQVDLAKDLNEKLPATRDALAEGDLSPEHARVIAEALRKLPGPVTAAERAEVEQSLVRQARQLDPARLRRAARRVLAALSRSEDEVEAHHDGLLRHDEDTAYAKTRLTMHDNGDGTTTGRFTIPTPAAAILRKTVQQMTAPSRQHSDGKHIDGTHSDGTDTAAQPPCQHPTTHPAAEPVTDAFGQIVWDDAETPQAQAPAPQAPAPQAPAPQASGPQAPGPYAPGPAAWGAEIDWAHQHGLALIELLEHLPTDRLYGKVAATIVVSVDLDRLLAGLGVAHTDTGQEISAAQARRWACEAGIVPIVLNGPSLPLDLGRQQRFFTEAQRTALAAVYDECAAAGCDRPYAWCHLHHRHSWSTGGPTNLADAVPLCGFHHRLVHDPTYHHEISTDARGRHAVTYTRREH